MATNINTRLSMWQEDKLNKIPRKTEKHIRSALEKVSGFSMGIASSTNWIFGSLRAIRDAVCALLGTT